MKLVRKIHTMALCKNDSKDVRRWKRVAAKFRQNDLAEGNFKRARKMGRVVRNMRKRDFKNHQ